MMLKFCSMLNSRLLLPPSTRPVPGSCGPMVRMSNPRTEYSPPRKSFWKIGSSFEPSMEWMYSPWARMPSDMPRVLTPVPDPLERGLVEVGVAAQAGEVDRGRVADALVGEDRLVDRVVHEARRDLADDALAVRADQQRVAQEGVAREHQRIGVRVGDLGDANALVAVVGEQPREAAEGIPEPDHAARRALRELADVPHVVPVQIDAAGDVAVEQERLGEGQRVVLRAGAGRQRHREALAPAEEVARLERRLAEEALELGDAGAEADLVAVLLFQLHLDVDLVGDARRLVDGDVLAVLERLEVAELIEPLDAELQRFGVEHAVFEEPHLAADDVVVRRRVADERDAVDEVLLPFDEPHRHVDDRRPGWRGDGLERLRRGRFGGVGLVAELVVGEAGELEVAAGAVRLARLLEAFADVVQAVEFALVRV